MICVACNSKLDWLPSFVNLWCTGYTSHIEPSFMYRSNHSISWYGSRIFIQLTSWLISLEACMASGVELPCKKPQQNSTVPDGGHCLNLGLKGAGNIAPCKSWCEGTLRAAVEHRSFYSPKSCHLDSPSSLDAGSSRSRLWEAKP